jgi:hypothetical protein
MRTQNRVFLIALVLVVSFFSMGFIGDLRVQFFNQWADGLYEKGDYAGAFEKYQSASDLDDGYATTQLFWMYVNGEGVRADEMQAVRMLQKAVKLGDSDAKVIMAKEMLLEPSLHTEAVYMLLDAAEQENILAYLELALLYKHGLAVPQNMAKSQEYLRLAAAHGVDINAFETKIVAGQKLNIQALTSTIQSNLAKLGFYKGKVDGITGPMTRKAISDFQQFYGYPVDTDITQTLLEQTQKALP